MHSGKSAEHGHYYCYGRSSDEAVKSGTKCNYHCTLTIAYTDNAPWYLMNDSNVTVSSFGALCNVTKNLPADVAYILFYRLKGQPEFGLSGKEHIPPSLKREVQEDNNAFLLEQENYNTTKHREHKQVSVVQPRFRDPDDREPPSAGGFGDFGFNRFVY